MLPQKSFKIRMLRMAEIEFHTTKFPDFSPCIKIPWHFQVFQVAGHPALLSLTKIIDSFTLFLRFSFHWEMDKAVVALVVICWQSYLN